MNLPSRQLAALHHGSVLFLEAFVQAGRALEEFVDAAHGAAFLTGDERLGGEIVDAVVEASLDEFGVHLNVLANLLGEEEQVGDGVMTYGHEFLHLLPLHARSELALFVG